MPKPEFANYAVPCRSCGAIPSVNLGGLCVHCVETIMEYHNQELVKYLGKIDRTLKLQTALSICTLVMIVLLIAVLFLF